jgi:hypothetical protein
MATLLAAHEYPDVRPHARGDAVVMAVAAHADAVEVAVWKRLAATRRRVALW